MPKRLADAFRLLRQGRHVCRDDGAVFRDLERHEDRYREIFQALGFRLDAHDRGFFYFQGESRLPTARLQAITLFVLILFQDLDEKRSQEPDRAWENTLTSRIFNVNELPHFATAARRDLMQDAGVTRGNLSEKVLRVLRQQGMLEMRGPGRFRFRVPVYRFVDLCLKFAEGDGLCQSNSADSAPLEDVSRIESTPGVVREVS